MSKYDDPELKKELEANVHRTMWKRHEAMRAFEVAAAEYDKALRQRDCFHHFRPMTHFEGQGLEQCTLCEWVKKKDPGTGVSPR